MAYEVTKWENRDKDNNIKGTALNAKHMNNIENGISALDTAVTHLSGQVASINLTPEQLDQLSHVATSLNDVQNELISLKAEFEAHVHENVVGETTGPVIIETDKTTKPTN